MIGFFLKIESKIQVINVYGEIDTIKYFEFFSLKVLKIEKRKVKIFVYVFIFSIFIRCDLCFFELLAKRFISKFFFKPSGVDFISRLSQKKELFE